ncbi:MAG: VOC family protein [Pseudomonadota bacterium]
MTYSKPLVLDRGGTSLDHVALGVPDTQRGVEEIAERLGYEPVLTEPESDQFYWSAALPLGAGRFLEILGPNPAFTKFNPFIEVVKRLEGPKPLFWYVATDDFAAFQAAAKQAGAPVERVETVTHERRGQVTDYTRGYLGPGFLSVSPNVIEWRSRYSALDEGEGPQFLGLQLSHPEADRLNTAFAKLGIDQLVHKGPHSMTLTLGTPNGPVEFSGEGLEFRGVGALAAMARSYGRWLWDKVA